MAVVEEIAGVAAMATIAVAVRKVGNKYRSHTGLREAFVFPKPDNLPLGYNQHRFRPF